jgi:hypothetical protein
MSSRWTGTGDGAGSSGRSPEQAHIFGAGRDGGVGGRSLKSRHDKEEVAVSYIPILVRSLPAILLELVSLIVHSLREGDRGTAFAGSVWLLSTLVFLASGLGALLAVITGGEAQLNGAVLVASIPLAMWLGRELVALLVGLVARVLGWAGLVS